MLVCHCHAINEARVRDIIANGAEDEVDVAAACGAGTECGGCIPVISLLLRECAGADMQADTQDEPAAHVR